MATPIGTIGNIPTFTVAGRLFTDLTTLINLATHVSSGGNRNGTFRKMGSGTSSGYQVTAGKTLIVAAAFFVINQTAASETPAVAQSDNDVGFDSASALTNAVYFGSESTSRFVLCVTPAAAVGSGVSVQLNGKVAAAKYCTVNGGNAADLVIQAWGYET